MFKEAQRKLHIDYSNVDKVGEALCQISGGAVSKAKGSHMASVWSQYPGTDIGKMAREWLAGGSVTIEKQKLDELTKEFGDGGTGFIKRVEKTHNLPSGPSAYDMYYTSIRSSRG